MVSKILKSGYCNFMMAYYVEYIDDKCGNTKTYFDYAHERNNFITNNKCTL